MSLKYTLQKLRRQPLRLTQRLRQQGTRRLVQRASYQLACRLRERRLGIDTLEHAYGIDVNGSGGCQHCDPIDYQCLDNILDHLQPNPERDVFLDYGAGLGRPVIAAAQRSFRRVIGVENNDLRMALCRKHVDWVRGCGALHCDLELVHQDAATYQVPHDVNRILMYNAFVSDELMQTVLQQIRQSLAESPRELVLVFVPLLRHEKMLENCSWLRQSAELPTAYWNHVRILVYVAQL